MTVCRYFLQGNCRFGDRCRFEHTAPSHENRYSQDYGYGRAAQVSYDQDRSSRHSDYSHSSNYNSNNKTSNYRYNSPNRYSNESNYETERNHYNDRYYTDTRSNSNYRYQSPNRYGESNYKTGSNQFSDRYYREAESESSDRYDQPHRRNFNRENTYQRNTNEYWYSSNDRYADNTYTQNQYRWQSDDYKKQKPQFNRSVQSDYQTSTPKPSSSFSFKVPESEIKTYQNVASSFAMQLDEKDQKFAEIVKEDATAWELGEQWPFTCYFPDPSKTAFPGFSDISPEELRCEAYKAKENNSYDAYVETVNNALIDIKQKRDQLKLLTPELLSILARIRKGEDLSQESTFAESSSLFQQDTETMISETVLGNQPTAASAFSFKLPSGDSAVKSSAASFSFKLPASKPTTLSSAEETEDHTPLEQLTDAEKEQFAASTFSLGKIPTNPPPRTLCF